MEDDIEKLYDALSKLNKKVSDMDVRNEEIARMLSSAQSAGPKVEPRDYSSDPIMEEENTVIDTRGMGGYRNISLPNGGAIRVKSKPFCFTGRHIVSNLDGAVFCSHCDSLICREHDFKLDEPICRKCVSALVQDIGFPDVYILFALVNGVPLDRIKRHFNLSRQEFSTAVSRLIKNGCAKRNLFFLTAPTFYGTSTAGLAAKIYDLEFIMKL